MSNPRIVAQMRDDWNARAREDAGYYVAFGRRGQDDAGFFATASEVIRRLDAELRRFPSGETLRLNALEIGCGPGRLMRPMSRHFAEVHGVDVSDEMIALACEKLRDTPNAFPHVSNGASLEQFGDGSFGFVYSYAVFQHIPSREVVYQYLREIRRVLIPGGLAHLQFNGLPRDPISEGSYNTWTGARFSAEEILQFTRDNDFQMLALEGASTQYMWTTWRKRPMQQLALPAVPPAAVRRITNASSSEPVAPCRGRFASISLWVENLPEDAGLHDLQVFIGGSRGTVEHIGPPNRDGFQQVNVALPPMDATGLLPVELLWRDKRISPVATLRVIPPGPLVPRLQSVCDAVNLVAENRIETRLVKMTLEEISRPEEIRASIDGRAVETSARVRHNRSLTVAAQPTLSGSQPLTEPRPSGSGQTDELGLDYFCVDPRPQRYEVNFRLPEEIRSGIHTLEVSLGRRRIGGALLEVM
ncbi:MAG TPA: class I SAM-dependent methyltransferase [Bryobacteraceae bacterium]|nr:class I SAM-dependent methyltransferase [Bryobacteraceae bacterium]